MESCTPLLAALRVSSTKTRLHFLPWPEKCFVAALWHGIALQGKARYVSTVRGRVKGHAEQPNGHASLLGLAKASLRFTYCGLAQRRSF
jgi:hypothetical protein